jgi:outer membrane protein TolC
VPVGIVTEVEVQSAYTVAYLKPYNNTLHPKTFFVVNDPKVTILENFDSNSTKLNMNCPKSNRPVYQVYEEFQTDNNTSDANQSLADINSSLIIAKAEFDVAKIQFEILTGKKIKCDVVLADKAIFNDDINIEKLVEDALDFHPALRILNAKIEAAKSDVASAQSKLWPTLKLRAEHRKGALYDSDSDKEENLVYLVFEMSTGAGASAFSNVERSKINVLKVKNQKLAKEKQVIDRLMDNYTRLVAVKNNMKILSNDVEIAEKVFNSNKRMFFLQQKKWIEVVNALTILNTKKISKFKLIEEYKALEMKLALKTNRLSLATGGVLSDVLQ